MASVTDWVFPTQRGAIQNLWLNGQYCFVSNDFWGLTNATASFNRQDYYDFAAGGVKLGDLIPASATINGVETRLEGFGAGNDALTITDRLVIGGSAVGDTKSHVWTTESSDAFKTAGGSSDTWSASLTTVNVRATSFGVYLTTTVAASTGKVDAVSLRVYYTLPGAIIVGGTAVALGTASGRTGFRLWTGGPGKVYLGNASVTAATGLPVAPGLRINLDVIASETVYAISDGTATVLLLEA